jgi:hypothetical protein
MKESSKASGDHKRKRRICLLQRPATNVSGRLRAKRMIQVAGQPSLIQPRSGSGMRREPTAGFN